MKIFNPSRNLPANKHSKTHLCGLVVRVLGYRSGGWPGFNSLHYQKKKVVGLERGPLSLVSITEVLLGRKVATPV
jgi:hypothetical protein